MANSQAFTRKTHTNYGPRWNADPTEPANLHLIRTRFVYGRSPVEMRQEIDCRLACAKIGACGHRWTKRSARGG